jgi:uracil-DNA glycosylase family 4
MSTLETSWRILEEDIVSCRKCPRLVSWREQVAATRRKAYQDWRYWGKPVPGFGDVNGRVLVIGLAPGAHGSNRTGRMFTGDASGEFLYQHLYDAGFASQPKATDRDDDLELEDIFITAICRCVPPGNKPTTEERKNCLPYLEKEITLLPNIRVIVVLGRMAYDTLFRMYPAQDTPHFKHGGKYKLGEGLPWVVMSYHPSRQNTQTGRLTPAMFTSIWEDVRKLIEEW